MTLIAGAIILRRCKVINKTKLIFKPIEFDGFKNVARCYYIVGAR